MSFQRIISDFRQRNLHIDFVDMLLTQKTAPENAISYRGKGYVRQTEDDILTFKLYAGETTNTNFLANLDRMTGIQSGELYSDKDLYELVGTASNGTIWVAKGVIPQCDWPSEQHQPIVYSQLGSIEVGSPAANPKSLSLHFFEKADLPVPIRNARFEAARCDFHLEKSDDSFTVHIKSDAALPRHFAIRVEEALRFLLAQSVDTRAIVDSGQVVLFSAVPKSCNIRLGPPISRGSSAFLHCSWHLFKAYLEYVVQQKFENWHPCTAYVHNACEASANSLDAWAIGLSVAVEGLASMIDIKQSLVETKRINRLQSFIVRQVASRKRLAPFTERVQGLVAGLTQVRAIDRMKWLADQGAAEQSHINAWRKLRNRGVHPMSKGAIDIQSLDFQKFLDEVHSVTVLMYHIV